MDTQVQKKFNILLVGDNCLDIYDYGTVDRISPEAPVPVFKYLRSEERPGMAGNVYNNLIALGCEVNFLHSETSTKTRLIDVRSNQHILRIDDDIASEPIVFETITNLDSYDAIVVSDYDKGTVSYSLVEKIISSVKCPIFIDTKKTDLARFEGAFVKINLQEYSKISTACSDLIITYGSQGAGYKENHWPALDVEVNDVTGAGDTFLSAMAYDYLISKDISSAIQFAIKAGAVTVKHLGVYAPTLGEINEA